MPKRTDLKKILIIGAGPIIIGQACEFDYSGSQACRALMAEGYDVVLVNSNPATIMTDPDLAHHTYIEPLTPEVLALVLERERPDAILPTMGGQTALNLAYQLHSAGVLDRLGIELIGARFEAIRIAEDRQAFKELILKAGLDMLRSETVSSVEAARPLAEELGYPLIIRPAFTLGGTGGGVVYAREDLDAAVDLGLARSPIGQVLLEESALGWKEYEFEVMRDRADNVVIVSSVENVDPMGVHTGDSITVAPAQTLSDKEYQTLRNASIEIIRRVGVDAGGCNIQFAVHPQTGRVVVIEMNPRVSRSSALVSKATGVPIAKISARLAVGLTMDEIPNDITQTTPACFEPALDYVVTKIPRFNFDKFPNASPELTPQMHSVGEVMAIGRTFQESFQKALRGLEIGLDGFRFPLVRISQGQLMEKLSRPTPDRIRWIYQAFIDSVSVEEIHTLTGIDPWFLENMRQLLVMERRLGLYALGQLPAPLFAEAKRMGFSDAQLSKILAMSPTPQALVAERREALGLLPVYKSVDTCAGEFEAITPYYYSTYDGSENEAPRPAFDTPARVVILGSGPNRIGQGLEFDYCCVHAAFTLKKLGYEAIMLNCNPETVSTDYDISARLYFEPLSIEDVVQVVAQEQPLGVVTQFGGQTPLKLARPLQKLGVPLLGTSPDNIDLAEDREKFGQMLQQLGLHAPKAGVARTELEALGVARDIGYPLICRPSYVLGGQSMRIFDHERSLRAYLSDIIKVQPDHPVLIERFLEEAMELDVDAVSDGQTTYIGGILEHIEHAGVHSGDSACVWPTQTVSPAMLEAIETATDLLARRLQVRGLLNIQFAVQNDVLYVLEVNPRASRTVPFVCKATGVPLIAMAMRVMTGEALSDVVATTPETSTRPQTVAVKVPVFPFTKFEGADPRLGPEMRSTGEVMGLDENFAMAYAKGQLGAGQRLPLTGQVFLSVTDEDKPGALPIARRLAELGFSLLATAGTAAYLQQNGLTVRVIPKKTQPAQAGLYDFDATPDAEALIEQRLIDLVINTPVGEDALRDDSYIRKAAVRHNVPMATTLSGARAVVEGIAALQQGALSVRSLQAHLQRHTAPVVSPSRRP
jgi:carbamoyl-phosphate synthase large subunit